MIDCHVDRSSVPRMTIRPGFCGHGWFPMPGAHTSMLSLQKKRSNIDKEILSYRDRHGSAQYRHASLILPPASQRGPKQKHASPSAANTVGLVQCIPDVGMAYQCSTDVNLKRSDRYWGLGLPDLGNSNPKILGGLEICKCKLGKITVFLGGFSEIFKCWPKISYFFRPLAYFRGLGGGSEIWLNFEGRRKEN
jgi:hypothetical protein